MTEQDAAAHRYIGMCRLDQASHLCLRQTGREVWMRGQTLPCWRPVPPDLSSRTPLGYMAQVHICNLGALPLDLSLPLPCPGPTAGSCSLLSHACTFVLHGYACNHSVVSLIHRCTKAAAQRLSILQQRKAEQNCTFQQSQQEPPKAADQSSNLRHSTLGGIPVGQQASQMYICMQVHMRVPLAASPAMQQGRQRQCRMLRPPPGHAPSPAWLM